MHGYPTPPPSPTLQQPCNPRDRIGQVLADRLYLEDVLGVGAYGVVYTARDSYDGRRYAVKALNKTGLDPRQRRFQQREIQLHHAASHHPNVVSLIQIMESEDTTFVVLEYCPEGDLFASITDSFFYAGKDELVRKAFLQVLDAVNFCHSLGIYHRDLKPENVLVADGGHTLKLADFGLATQDKYTSDYGCGSTFYMSSECQAASPAHPGRYASAPNDVWALGVILVNLACGRNPWKRASTEDPTFRAYLKDPHFLSSILPISGGLENILRRIFDCNPSTRITLPELRKLIQRCPSFSAPPHRPDTPPPECDSPPQVVPAPPVPQNAPLTPPPTPPIDGAFKPPANRAPLSPVSQGPGLQFHPPPPPPPAPRTPAPRPPPPASPAPRTPAPGPVPVAQCAPIIGADLFNFIPSTGSWIRPSGHALPASPLIFA